MKRALLLLIVAAAFSQAKAQQQFQLKPADSLKTDLFQLYRAPKNNPQPLLIEPKINLNQSPLMAAGNVKIAAYDRMPVAMLDGYSKMPVVKLNSDDKMPVLKLDNNGFSTVPNSSKTP